MTLSRQQRRQQSGFPARLREVIARFGSVSALAAAVARSEGAVRKWLRGDSEPGITDLRAVCEATGTGIEWLVNGRGSPGGRAELLDRTIPYGDPRHPPLDLTLLESVVSAVEAELRAAGATLGAVKHAALIAACYDLAQGSGTVDPRAIARLVKLAG